MVTHLLIPGLVSDGRIWRALGDTLAPRGPVVHGDVTRDDSIAAMAARLLAETEGPLVIVGHSMGGRVAMEMANQAPGRVRALVLANTGHNRLGADERPKREAKIALGHESMQSLAAEWLPPMLDPARTGDAELMAELTDMVLAAGADVHERQIRALMGRPDAGEYLPQLACPILLLTGAQDGWSPEAQHRHIADLAPDAELRVIESAGHFMPVERPDKTNAAINDWLDRRAADIYD